MRGNVLIENKFQCSQVELTLAKVCVELRHIWFPFLLLPLKELTWSISFKVTKYIQSVNRKIRNCEMTNEWGFCRRLNSHETFVKRPLNMVTSVKSYRTKDVKTNPNVQIVTRKRYQKVFVLPNIGHAHVNELLNIF